MVVIRRNRINNYNLLSYAHKNLMPKELMFGFGDEDFKYQVVMNYREPKFTSSDLQLFYKHLRNINLCLNKLVKYEPKEKTFNSLKNSIKYFYINYLESFIDSIISHYFYTFKEDEKRLILNKVLYEIWEKNENNFK